ncbi:MAG: DUF6912 family protein [Propionibacteriaceae bacterium]
MVFVGATRAQLEAWRAGDEAGTSGVGATAAMIAAHGYGPNETEDAEYVALQYAGVASLLCASARDARRWVAAADVAEVADAGSPYGLVEVAVLRWRDVQAFFTDEIEAFHDVATLAASVAGRPLAEVLADAAVLDAAEVHDLLWYAPDELDRVE